VAKWRDIKANSGAAAVAGQAQVPDATSAPPAGDAGSQPAAEMPMALTPPGVDDLNAPDPEGAPGQ
jgi:hypothetical protein